MKINWLQHVPFEGLGAIEDWSATRGLALEATHLWSGEPLPEAGGVEALIVMGGPMGVGDVDEYPWLAPEVDFVRRVIELDTPVLGICLGAQLMAAALGADVTVNPEREIGWFPVHLSDEARLRGPFAGEMSEFTPFHWHGETFATPEGALAVASSDACINQAFLAGERALALQFHLETRAAEVEALVENCADEIVDGKWIQTASEMRGGTENAGPSNELLFRVLDRLFIG